MKPKQGGAREGAGRKPVETVKYALKLSRSTLDGIHRNIQPGKYSQFCDKAINEALTSITYGQHELYYEFKKETE